METKTAPEAAAPSRILAWAGLGIAVLIVATTTLAVLREPQTFAADTPEAVVQAYAQAMLAGEEDAAAAQLDLALECDAGDLADAHIPDDVRVNLRSVAIDGDVAEIDVVVSVTSGRGPFETYEYDESHRFELARSGDRWLITERPWPWASCWR